METIEAVAIDGHRYIYEVDKTGWPIQWSSVHSENCACANTYWEVDR